MNPETSGTTPAPASSNSALYRAVWRWHFYAGLIAVPFLLIFAVTGMIMVYGNSVETFLGKNGRQDNRCSGEEAEAAVGFHNFPFVWHRQTLSVVSRYYRKRRRWLQGHS